jgi:hypothetical protein
VADHSLGEHQGAVGLKRSEQKQKKKRPNTVHGAGPFDLVAGAGFEPATFRL